MVFKLVSQPVELDVWAELKWFRIGVVLWFSWLCLARRAGANATILLEEPYSYDGALAGTGHTAVYLSRICAETPVKLRRCNPGERGSVISRYTPFGGAYDWYAIPLVPYLYAVDKPEDIPLYADPKLVAFLRDQYRRAHLEEYAPDAPDGSAPKGDWYELIGSSYDRTNYGFEIETTPEQDDAFIVWMNARPNRAQYQFMSRNCADFVREILNFYYPKSVSRAAIADLLVSTPKHAANSLARYGKHHPDLEFTRFVIPQVPGSVKRSRPVRGVLESLIRAKKYALVLAAFHPFIGGSVISADLVGDRFHPARNSVVFNVTGEPQAPPSKAEKKMYLKDLHALEAGDKEIGAASRDIAWRKFVEKARPGLDAEGQPLLEAPDGQHTVELGLTRRDLQSDDAPADLQKELMISRLKQTLARSRAPRISGAELREDWQLLEKIDQAGQERLAEKLDSGN
jgi:hypothetical protein